MANLVNWIENLAGGEAIEAVVIGGMGWSGDYNSEKVPTYNLQPKNVVLSWAEARPLLDYDFYAGLGAPQCNAITVWTKSWVIAVSQYDGATAPFRIPRNPVPHEPIMPGGGG